MDFGPEAQRKNRRGNPVTLKLFIFWVAVFLGTVCDLPDFLWCRTSGLSEGRPDKMRAKKANVLLED